MVNNKWRKRTPDELAKEASKRKAKLPVVLFLHNIRSQYNVGAILRTADAVGIEKVILSGYTPTPEQKGVKKTALRGLVHKRWEFVADVVKVLQQYKMDGYQIVGLEQCHESVDFQKAKYAFPVVLVLGEEVEGIHNDILRYCDQLIEIPMFGAAHSLNVSVATGIVLYELLDQFRGATS